MLDGASLFRLLSMGYKFLHFRSQFALPEALFYGSIIIGPPDDLIKIIALKLPIVHLKLWRRISEISSPFSGLILLPCLRSHAVERDFSFFPSLLFALEFSNSKRQ
jgi:hypothetical protein